MPGITIFPSRGLLPQLATHFVSAAWLLAAANMVHNQANTMLFSSLIFVPFLQLDCAKAEASP
jgi:hypothetical protein